MRRMLVVGAVTVLGLGVGGTALAATNAERTTTPASVPADRSGVSSADDPPSHDALDDNGADAVSPDPTVSPSPSLDDHGLDPAGHDVGDDHGGGTSGGSGHGGGAGRH